MGAMGSMPECGVAQALQEGAELGTAAPALLLEDHAIGKRVRPGFRYAPGEVEEKVCMVTSTQSKGARVRPPGV